MPFVFEQDSPDHRDEDEAFAMDMNMINANEGDQVAGYYDSYNGGFWEDEEAAGRYTGEACDPTAARLEQVLGHA